MKKLNKIKGYAVPLLCGIFFFVLLQFVFLIGYVPTDSMVPTIKEGSLVFGYRIFSNLDNKDVVVFEHDGRLLTKRIAAMPGETVYIDSNNKFVSDAQDAERILMVPENCYFLLGDNTNSSIDSRFWSNPFVPKEDIVAKLWNK